MFIELTDHLRCPEAHEEAYLVLLPDRVEARAVLSGRLGCPICGREFTVREGELDIGGAPEPEPAGGVLDADGMTALVGLQGPGGYLVLVGSAADAWRGVAARNPGVAVVAINPSEPVAGAPLVSVVRGGMIPLKANSMRGVVLGRGYGADPRWIEQAARVTLPGLRVVGEGPDPQAEALELLASAGGAWVASKVTRRH